jgi:hypothetical protein
MKFLYVEFNDPLFFHLISLKFPAIFSFKEKPEEKEPLAYKEK